MTRPPARAERFALLRSMRFVALQSATALVLLASCATTPPGTPVQVTQLDAAPPPRGTPFEPMGELRFSGGRSAGYNLHRVVGPTVNVSYTADGKWAGTCDGHDVWLTATPGKLSGPGVALNLFAEGDQITIRGTWFQRQVWINISPKALNGRTGAASFDFTRTAPDAWSGHTAGGRGGVRALGDAQKFPNVPMPQFALALIAALP